LYSSESSSDADGEESESEPSTPTKPVTKTVNKLVRDVTVTLDDEFEVDKIIEGPRPKDGKYLVSWVGYEACDNTWEPKSNLPDSCFKSNTESSDESGDEIPLVQRLRLDEAAAAKVLQLARDEEDILEEADNVRRQAIADAASLSRAQAARSPALVAQRKSRIQPVVANRTTYESKKGGMRPRTNRIAF
jgi:hypothetical protein